MMPAFCCYGKSQLAILNAVAYIFVHQRLLLLNPCRNIFDFHTKVFRQPAVFLPV
jgi:hypothetical protein